MKEELKNQCMELIYQGWTKEMALHLVEEIFDSLQREGKDD